MTARLNQQNANHEDLWRIELPTPIEVQFHPHWGPLLAGFPQELTYCTTRIQFKGSEIVVRTCYKPDPSSFVEDRSKSQVRYLPVLRCDYYVDVVWDKVNQRWQTTKYQADRIVAQATGRTFRGAMIQTLLIGLQLDEPAI